MILTLWKEGLSWRHGRQIKSIIIVIIGNSNDVIRQTSTDDDVNDGDTDGFRCFQGKICKVCNVAKRLIDLVTKLT